MQWGLGCEMLGLPLVESRQRRSRGWSLFSSEGERGFRVLFAGGTTLSSLALSRTPCRTLARSLRESFSVPASPANNVIACVLPTACGYSSPESRYSQPSIADSSLADVPLSPVTGIWNSSTARQPTADTARPRLVRRSPQRRCRSAGDHRCRRQVSGSIRHTTKHSSTTNAARVRVVCICYARRRIGPYTRADSESVPAKGIWGRRMSSA